MAFRRGARESYGIRWFGSTALLGHLRQLGAEALASGQLDTRDWMRPQPPTELLDESAIGRCRRRRTGCCPSRRTSTSGAGTVSFAPSTSGSGCSSTSAGRAARGRRFHARDRRRGGSFVHGTRVHRYPRGKEPACAFPDRTTSRRLAASVPFQLVIGTAGLLPHVLCAGLAAAQVAAFRGGVVAGWLTTGLIAALAALFMFLAVMKRHERPWASVGLD